MARRNLQLVQDQQKQNSRRSTPLKVTEHDLKRFDPITDTQNQFWQKYKRKQALLLHGSAGTGKTFIALYKAMEDVMHRGITLDNSIVVVDECQNMSDMEINSIMTRIGHNSKIIFCGDFRQTDLYKSNDKSGLKKFIQIAESMPSFDTVEFGPEDIVRSELVKEYILARVAWEDLHENT